MAEGDFIWIYLVFFMIPLARVIPRLIRKWQNKNNPVSENQYKQDFQRPEQKQPNLKDQKHLKDLNHLKESTHLKNQMRSH